ncbi:cation diffusion facilitator family transporter [Leptospira sp. GIMC2001]|uniref:cation diffusion facilitator family transporter n=1 Tax=Leptospira sp. GIMC2001 TaxID=1513297 RepID=UPI00234B13FC|nr:cation diffusion facilitator family transporter [Leptospira sp. GIMC2001]WCL48122.1 cation diffusion facilitator family transporter [Leptospira sp. GIMC2001]
MLPEENLDHYHFLTEKEAKRSKKSLLISLGISFFIFIVELYGAYQSNSIALLTDAFHIVTDMLAHVISLIAVSFSLRNRTIRFSFGFLRFEILAAFLNAILLILLCGFLLYESIERFIDPHEIHADSMLAFSLIGLFLNSISALILFTVSKTSINLKSAYFHVLGDLLGTVAVVIGAIIIRFTNLAWIDSVFSLLIILIIGRATYSLLKESLYSLLEASPNPHKLTHILSDIKSIPKVQKILSYHHWNLTSGVECVNLRLLIKDKKLWESVTTETHKLLKEEYGITHVNVELASKESSDVLDTIVVNHDNRHSKDGHGHHHGHSH